MIIMDDWVDPWTPPPAPPRKFPIAVVGKVVLTAVLLIGMFFVGKAMRWSLEFQSQARACEAAGGTPSATWSAGDRLPVIECRG